MEPSDSHDKKRRPHLVTSHKTAWFSHYGIRMTNGAQIATARSKQGTPGSSFLLFLPWFSRSWGPGRYSWLVSKWTTSICILFLVKQSPTFWKVTAISGGGMIYQVNQWLIFGYCCCFSILGLLGVEMFFMPGFKRQYLSQHDPPTISLIKLWMHFEWD